MDRYDLIASFQDTLTLSVSGELGVLTKKAVDTSKVYYEGFNSGVQPGEAECSIEISANTTFAEAQKYAKEGRVAVLNFANPVNPGGGVESGAMAQEECLCRSSNLYTCLRAGHLYDEYYDYHSKLNNHFYSDRLIYSRDVTVFKDDNAIPVALPRENWFNVDVITCAAPYLGGVKYTNPTVLRHLFQGRIRNILEAALDNKADTIVLGAFGCGAFKNPAWLVAEEFKSVIECGQYCKKFKNIVFAIKKESEKDFGENYRTFVNVLGFTLLLNCPTYDLPEVQLPTGKVIKKATVGFCHLFADKTIEDVKDLTLAGEGFPDTSFNKDTENFDKQYRFLKWQRNNPYYKKQISILGDSISTLDGYNPLGHNLFFKGEVCEKSGVKNMSDTWWGQVIELLGAELLVNNSWSGSRVSKLPGSQSLFPSGCSDERTGNLHMYDVKPDVIIVYLGTNDWGYGVPPEPKRMGFFDEHKKIHVDGFAAPDESVFSFAYDTMLKKLRKNYPDAEICCCTLNTTYMSENPGFVFPVAHGGTHIDVYNNIIRSAANRFKCKLIDLAGYHKAYDSIDGSHPNAEGMKTLASMMLRELDCYVAPFLDCEQGKHNYVLAERNTGDDKYVCSVCAKVKHERMLFIRKIVKAHISYSDGDFGRIITLDGTTLSWRNAISPGRPPVLDYDFSEKKIELSEKDAQLLAYELGNVALDGCVSDSVLDYPPGASYSIFTCTYDDGSEFKYITRFKAAPEFERLKVILNNHCVSPVSPIIPPVVPPMPPFRPPFTPPKPPVAPTPIVPIQLGTVIEGKYKLEKILAVGPHAVYLASVVGEDKKVAVKVEDISRFNNAAVISSIREAFELHKAIKHPDISEMIEMIQTSKYICLVTEYLEGETLDRVLASETGPMESKRAAIIGRNIAQILQSLHKLNPPVVCRDVKPSNIMIHNGSDVKMFDFGIAMRFYEDRQDAQIVGTVGYAAPEQYKGHTRPETDIYGLGMTLYYILTRDDPKTPGFVCKSIKALNPNVDPELVRIVEKCVEPDLRNRYRSCEELINDLERFIKGRSSSLFGRLFGNR